MPFTEWMLSPRRSREFHQVKGAAQDSHRECRLKTEMLRVPLLRTGLQAVPEEGGIQDRVPPPFPRHPAGLAGSPAWSGGRGGGPTSHATATATTVSAGPSVPDPPRPIRLSPLLSDVGCGLAVHIQLNGHVQP